MLSQKVYCEECGSIFMKNVYKVKGEKYGKRAYLQCKGHKKYHFCNNNHSVRLDLMEEFVLKSINELLQKCNKEKLKEEYLKEVNEKNKTNVTSVNLNKEKVSIEKSLSEKKLYFKNLYEDKLKGVLTDDDFKMLREEYSKEVNYYQKRLEEITKELEEVEIKKEYSIDIESILKKYSNINELNKAIIDEFIEKIYVGLLDKETKTREIKIEWNLDL